jgi:hypothetical protein
VLYCEQISKRRKKQIRRSKEKGESKKKRKRVREIKI